MTKLTRTDAKPGVAAGDRVREERAKYQRESDDALRAWRDSSAELPRVVVIQQPTTPRNYFEIPPPVGDDGLEPLPRTRRSFIEQLRARDRRAVGGAVVGVLVAAAALAKAIVELWGMW